MIATGFDCTTAFCLSTLGEKGYSVYLEIFGGGYGASKGADGCDAVDSPLSNCSNAPVESLDIDYDFFRIVGYELAPDSFGLGARRGGAGFLRRCEILGDDVQLAIYSDRFRLAPEGLLGGEPGQRGYCRIFRANGTTEDLKSKAAVDLAKGDIVEMFVGGGAGFRPRQRAARRADRPRPRRRPPHARSEEGTQARGGVVFRQDLERADRLQVEIACFLGDLAGRAVADQAAGRPWSQASSRPGCRSRTPRRPNRPAPG